MNSSLHWVGSSMMAVAFTRTGLQGERVAGGVCAGIGVPELGFAR